MRAPASLAAPGPADLGGAWRALAPWRPRGLWLTRLWLHHVEALVRARVVVRLDPLAAAVLGALAPGPAPGPDAGRRADPGELADRLGLGRPLVGAVLAELARDGLAAGHARGGWEATDAGRAGLASGEFIRSGRERRLFHFFEAPDPARGVHFVPLRPGPYPPAAPPPGWRFDPAVLAECARRTAEWKRRHGFPADVEEVLLPSAAGAGSAAGSAAGPAAGGRDPEPPWRRVLLDRAEQAVLLLATVPPPEGAAEGSGDHLVGLAVDPASGALAGLEPVLRLGSHWRDALPGLAPPPAEADWQQAWRSWCGERDRPDAGHAPCRPRPGEPVVEVSLAAEVLRLLAPPGGGRAGEFWLQAGQGPCRALAVVRPAGSAGPEQPG